MVGTPTITRADEVRIHAMGAATRALGDPQASELSWGGGGSLAVERPFGNVFGLQLELLGFGLTDGSAPADPTLANRSGGGVLGGAIGARLRPFGGEGQAGLWLDGNGGVSRTGPVTRPIFDGHIGYDFAIGKKDPSFGLGPVVGYTHVFQPNDTVRPADAHVLWLGIHGVLGFGSKKVEPPPPPRGDRDADTVFDDEDACPDDAGSRTSDPKTSGCPRGDRDHDTVFDDEDACPDVAGVRTGDPKTNGCPRPDRDNDAVLDDEDACPDVPGERTNDPKTSGCPKSEGPVHVAGDKIVLDERILFDTDSPRVRHASFGLVQKVATLISANPDVLEIDIEGHADRIGTDAHNLQLSRERAESVKRLLVKFGIDGKRLTTHYYGESRPRAAGSGQEQLRENRRVEFTVVRAQPKSGAATPQGAPAGATPEGGHR